MTSDPKSFRVGLLGHGTVGSAFAELLGERADHIAAITGLRPELTGVLTTSRGTFEEVVGAADLVVELIGGLEPARAERAPGSWQVRTGLARADHVDDGLLCILNVALDQNS